MASDQNDRPNKNADTKIESGSLINVDPHPTAQREADKDFDLDQSRKRLSNKQYEQNIRERRKYALYAYRITRTWVRALIFFVISQMFLKIFNAGLTPEEFITLVTTTTASVFGFWWLVGKYLFGQSDD